MRSALLAGCFALAWACSSTPQALSVARWKQRARTDDADPVLTVCGRVRLHGLLCEASLRGECSYGVSLIGDSGEDSVPLRNAAHPTGAFTCTGAPHGGCRVHAGPELRRGERACATGVPVVVRAEARDDDARQMADVGVLGLEVQRIELVR